MPELSPEQKLALFGIIQKTFMLGLLCGRNQLTGMTQPKEAIEAAVNNSNQALSEVYPGSDVSAYLSELVKNIKL